MTILFMMPVLCAVVMLVFSLLFRDIKAGETL